MKRSVFPAATAALAAAGFTGAGSSAPGPGPPTGTPAAASPTHFQDVLAYGVPSVRSTTYQVADTMILSIGSQSETTQLKSVAGATLSVNFRGGPEGVRVEAEIMDFSGSTGNAEMGTMSLGRDDATGSMIFIVGPTGAIEEVARPELSRNAGQFSLFNQLPYDLFPGLPGRAADPGESWSDTVVWHSAAGGMETTSITARTYTLVGDTVMDGRSLLTIALSAEVAISASGSQGGRATTSNITGTLTGRVLWDADTGLLHMAELMRDYTGESTMEGRPPGAVGFAGIQRLRREE